MMPTEPCPVGSLVGRVEETLKDVASGFSSSCVSSPFCVSWPSPLIPPWKDVNKYVILVSFVCASMWNASQVPGVPKSDAAEQTWSICGLKPQCCPHVETVSKTNKRSERCTGSFGWNESLSDSMSRAEAMASSAALYSTAVAPLVNEYRCTKTPSSSGGWGSGAYKQC